MARKYVCNPRTGRVIEVDGSTYKKVSKNAADMKKLSRSPKSSTKKKLCCASPTPKRRRRSPKKRRRAAGCGRHVGSSAPSSAERKRMAEKCDTECFLGDNMRFAVCDEECRHSPLRTSAACNRARQLGSPRSQKVRGRDKVYYNRIAQRALDLRQQHRFDLISSVNPAWTGKKEEPVKLGDRSDLLSSDNPAGTGKKEEPVPAVGGSPCRDLRSKPSCEQTRFTSPRRDSLSGDMYYPRRCRWKIPMGPCEDLPKEYVERATFQRESPRG